MSDPGASGGSASVRFALLIAIVSISFAAIFVRLAAPTHPLIIAGTRLCVAGLLLLVPTARALLDGRLPRRLRWRALLGGVLYAAHFGTWVASLVKTSVASSVTLVTATPLMLAAMSFVSGRDRPTGRQLVAIALGLIGLAVIGWADLQLSADALIGDGLALVGAVAMALYLYLVRGAGPSLDVLGFSGITTLVGGILLLGLALLLQVPIHYASTTSLGFIVLSAIVPQLIGHNLLTWSLRHTTPTAVGIATIGEPVGATLIAWLLLGDQVGPLVLIGCAITLAAVVLSLRRRPAV